MLATFDKSVFTFAMLTAIVFYDKYCFSWAVDVTVNLGVCSTNCNIIMFVLTIKYMYIVKVQISIFIFD